MESPEYTMLPAQLSVFSVVVYFVFKAREVIIVCLWLCMKTFFDIAKGPFLPPPPFLWKKI